MRERPILFSAPEVTDVRIERLQAISEEDAHAEGIYETVTSVDGRANDPYATSGTQRGLFSILWDSLNAKRAPWSSNPWVWVVCFDVLSPQGGLNSAGEPEAQGRRESAAERDST